MPLFGNMVVALKADRMRMQGQTEQQIVESLAWHELTLSELWDRLLRRNRAVQRLCPKTAFLKALDAPRLEPRFQTKSQGPQ